MPLFYLTDIIKLFICPRALSLRLWHELLKHETGHDSNVISNHTPKNLRIKMVPTFPLTSKQIKTSLKIRYDSLHSASPFLQSCLHMNTCHYVLQGSYDLVKNNINNPILLRLFLILQRRIASIRRHITRLDPIIVCHPL